MTSLDTSTYWGVGGGGAAGRGGAALSAGAFLPAQVTWLPKPRDTLCCVAPAAAARRNRRPTGCLPAASVRWRARSPGCALRPGRCAPGRPPSLPPHLFYVEPGEHLLQHLVVVDVLVLTLGVEIHLQEAGHEVRGRHAVNARTRCSGARAAWPPWGRPPSSSAPRRGAARPSSGRQRLQTPSAGRRTARRVGARAPATTRARQIAVQPAAHRPLHARAVLSPITSSTLAIRRSSVELIQPRSSERVAPAIFDQSRGPESRLWLGRLHTRKVNSVKAPSVLAGKAFGRGGEGNLFKTAGPGGPANSLNGPEMR